MASLAISAEIPLAQEDSDAFMIKAPRDASRSADELFLRELVRAEQNVEGTEAAALAPTRELMAGWAQLPGNNPEDNAAWQDELQQENWIAKKPSQEISNSSIKTLSSLLKPAVSYRDNEGASALKGELLEVAKYQDKYQDKQVLPEQSQTWPFVKKDRVLPPATAEPSSFIKPLSSLAMAVKNKEGVQQFQNHLQDEFILKPMTARTDQDRQVSQQIHPVIAAREFLGGLQNQVDNLMESQTLAMDGLGELAGSDTGQLIDRISRYISQKMMGGTKELDLNIKHQEIGHFKLNVAQDSGQEGVQLTITVFSREGADFFGLNQSYLLGNLGQKGIQVQDFKLDHQVGEDQEGHYFSHGDKGEGDSRSHQRQEDHPHREMS